MLAQVVLLIFVLHSQISPASFHLGIFVSSITAAIVGIVGIFCFKVQPINQN